MGRAKCWNIGVEIVNWIEDTPPWSENPLYKQGAPGINGRDPPEVALRRLG